MHPLEFFRLLKTAIFTALFLLSGSLSAEPAVPEPETRQLPLAPGIHFDYYVIAPEVNTLARDKPDRIVVVLHGTKRNGEEYLQNLYRAWAGSGSQLGLLLVAPEFRIEEDAREPGLVHWKASNDWKQGELSAPDHGLSISSFEVLDRLLLQLNDSLQPDEFVLVGHSAGGQFYQRHAIASRVDQQMSTPVTYVVANPSSFAYLDKRRPDLNETDASGFAIPASPPDDFDDWKYGLSRPNEYLQSAMADTDVIANYRDRKVIYLAGEADTERGGNLATSLPAELQGRNRLERARFFFRYLEVFYGDQPHRMVTVPGVGHTHAGMFASPEGQALLFHQAE